jgi:hypothetical protein
MSSIKLCKFFSSAWFQDYALTQLNCFTCILPVWQQFYDVEA